MAFKRATIVMWMVVAMVAILVAENVKMCNGSDQVDQTVDKVKEDAEDIKNGWGDWFKKISSSEKEETDSDGMKEGAQKIMDKAKDSASQASSYLSDKAEEAKESAPEAKDKAEGMYEGAKDKAEGMFDWAKQKFGEAYGSAKDKVSGDNDNN